MLIQRVFVSLAIVTGILAEYLDAPQGPADYSYVGPLIDSDTAYTKEQVDQVHQASNDAVYMAKTACNAEKNSTFDTVFQKYFDIKDRDFVISKWLTEQSIHNRTNPTDPTIRRPKPTSEP